MSSCRRTRSGRRRGLESRQYHRSSRHRWSHGSEVSPSPDRLEERRGTPTERRCRSPVRRRKTRGRRRLLVPLLRPPTRDLAGRRPRLLLAEEERRSWRRQAMRCRRSGASRELDKRELERKERREQRCRPLCAARPPCAVDGAQLHTFTQSQSGRPLESSAAQNDAAVVPPRLRRSRCKRDAASFEVVGHAHASAGDVPRVAHLKPVLRRPDVHIMRNERQPLGAAREPSRIRSTKQHATATVAHLQDKLMSVVSGPGREMRED